MLNITDQSFISPDTSEGMFLPSVICVFLIDENEARSLSVHCNKQVRKPYSLLFPRLFLHPKIELSLFGIRAKRAHPKLDSVNINCCSNKN